MTCKVERGRKRLNSSDFLKSPVLNLKWYTATLSVNVSAEWCICQWALLTPDEVLFFPEGVCLVCKPKYEIFLTAIKYAFKRCLIQKVWSSIFFFEISSKWLIRSLLSITELCWCIFLHFLSITELCWCISKSSVHYWNQLVPQALIKLFVHEYFRAKRNIAYILLLTAA